jgi:hypothetical protein
MKVGGAKGLLLQPHTVRNACGIVAVCLCPQEATHHQISTSWQGAYGLKEDGRETQALFPSLLEPACLQPLYALGCTHCT